MEWYEDIYNRPIFFQLYEEGDTRQAKFEVDSLIQLLSLQKDWEILDLCCGYGRHAIELAKRKFRVTGVDMSEIQIRRAKEKAAEAKVEVEFIVGDARCISEVLAGRQFDVVINMFISFGFFQTDAEHLKMLIEVAKVTKQNGLFLMEQWNREKEIRDFQKMMCEKYNETIIVKEWEFDYLLGRLNWQNTVIFPNGKRESWYHSIRAYTIAELNMLLGKAGFDLQRVVGSLGGEKYNLNSPNAILIAKRRR